MLSCDVIIWDDNTPLFYFSWKLHSLQESFKKMVRRIKICFSKRVKIGLWIFYLGEGVGLGDEWDDINPVVNALQELHI